LTTMQTHRDPTDQFLADFGALKTRALEGEADWLDPLRESAMAAFQSLGFPTRRHEEWKYTDLKPLRDHAFALAEDRASALSPERIDELAIPGLDGHRLVFVDGHFQAALSSCDELPDGVTVMSLAEAIRDRRELIEPRLGRLADHEADAFTALNTAFIEDGVVVHVPENVTVDRPIQVLSITTGHDQPIATHPRNLILAERNATVTVIEHYVGLGENLYLTNAVTELFADERATVHHYLIERESERALNVSTLKIHQGESSDVHSHTALLGGSITRNNVHPILDGSAAHCLINGLYIGHTDQHHDNHMRVEHRKPGCDSRQYYKGILTDKAHGVFTGRIVCHKEGQQTDAVQTNRNLLLSDEAQINARPQLEIYADDVKCTHGATTGQIDPAELFYLRSRGIPEQTARAMMIYAFAGEMLDRVPLEPVVELLGRELMDRLPQAAALKKIIRDG